MDSEVSEKLIYKSFLLGVLCELCGCTLKGKIMAQYPRRHAEVTALVDLVIAGFTEHPGEFPHGDAGQLETARAEFITAGYDLADANAQTDMAASVKKQKFHQLEAVMKQQIKLAQVDCAADPVKLSFIGWGPRRRGETIEPPDAPHSLRILDRSEDTLTLTWRKPPRNPHRPVGCYQVYRRPVNGSAESWQLAGTALETEFPLTSPPAGQTEYRITALNRTGESLPSNTITVVV